MQDHKSFLGDSLRGALKKLESILLKEDAKAGPKGLVEQNPEGRLPRNGVTRDKKVLAEAIWKGPP